MQLSNASWTSAQQDTVVAVLRRAAAEHGTKPYLDLLSEIYSYADIHRESSRLANGLHARGVARFDPVVTILDNNLDAVLMWFAINKLGAISVPVNASRRIDRPKMYFPIYVDPSSKRVSVKKE